MKKEETNDRDLTIVSITAVPRTKNFYNFYINGAPEKRSIKPEKLIDLITELCPLVGGTARTMVYELRSFYVEVETDTIQELSEIPKKQESHKELVFDNRKKLFKKIKNSEEPKLIDKQKDRIFNNILKLVKLGK